MRYFLSIVALAVTFSSSAQSLPNVAIGAIQNGSTLEIIAEPTSTIALDITLQTSSFTAGVYSRYAQKYLGERAQLTDKKSTIIKGAQLSVATSESTPVEQSTTPKIEVNSPAQTLSIDRTSADVMIPEVAAQNAANQIFANRRICRDLIAGDVGEGVFGEGLQTALDRFDQMEREYLSLFMGQEKVTIVTHREEVTLSSDKTRYMVGRFDSQKGLLPATEIDGDPVYLQITPSEVKDSTYIAPGSKGSTKRIFVVPNMAKCDLYVGADIIASATLPLYTFGSRATLLYDPK